MYGKNDNMVLDQAIEAFNREAVVQLQVIDTDRPTVEDWKRPRVDAVIGLKGYEPLQYAVQVKKWAQHANFGSIIQQLRSLPMKGLLVADYINPPMAERLKEEGIQFIDMAGNAYINADPVFIYIKGNRKNSGPLAKREEKRRVFTRTGLKVIFSFLCAPDLVRKPYRDIADAAEVALGTVGWVMRDLKKMMYLVDRGDRESRRLEKYIELLDKWVELYPVFLRPGQFIGEFNKDAATDLKKVNLEKYDAYWGGEVAGAYYTNYLRGDIDTIYVPDNRKKELISDLKLLRNGDDKYGKVRLYGPFWKKPAVYSTYVHPVLACADLVATGDARNIETAGLIMDKYFRPEQQG